MSVPSQINDGDWSQVQYMEDAPSFPFSEKGDNQTFEVAMRYMIDKAHYRPRAAMTRFQHPVLGSCYLTKLGSPRDTGNGLYDVSDTFSSVPVSRTEGGSFGYTAQWWSNAIGDVDPSKYFYSVNYDVEEQTFTLQADIVFEYFKDTAPPPLLKPRVFLLFGKLVAIGGQPIVGNRVVAEDSQVTIYRAKIYERRTIYVQLQSPTAV